MQPDNAAAAPAARTPLLTYGVDAGVGESDNVTLVSTDKISQTIAIADADFTVKEQSRLLDVNAAGQLQLSRLSAECLQQPAARPFRRRLVNSPSCRSG